MTLDAIIGHDAAIVPYGGSAGIDTCSDEVTPKVRWMD